MMKFYRQKAQSPEAETLRGRNAIEVVHVPQVTVIP